MATGRDLHIDAPLSNLAIKAFNGAEDFVGPKLFPIIPVDKQSNKYYTISKDQWLRVPSSLRAPKTSPRRIEFDVSSDSYFAFNYALAAENALEDLDNADVALRLRETSTQNVTEALLRDLEVRLVNLVTSISNIGSGVALTGTNKWSDFTNSDPIADITSGHAFIQNNTGLLANTLVIDKDTFYTVRRHPVLLDMFKYTQGGMLEEAQLKSVFGVDTIHIARGIKNIGIEGQVGSLANIWGNIALLARVIPAMSVQTATFGLAFRWTPAGVPSDMQVFRYNDADPGKKIEVLECGYYQDEQIVAPQLAYLINNTL